MCRYAHGFSCRTSSGVRCECVNRVEYVLSAESS
jgi:hypothetical protein